MADWLEHPVSQILREVLAGKRQARKDAWESGEVLQLGQDEQMLRNAAAIGECQGFKYVQELDFETLQGDMEDARESEWVEAARPSGAGQDGGNRRDEGKPDQNT